MSDDERSLTMYIKISSICFYTRSLRTNPVNLSTQSSLKGVGFARKKKRKEKQKTKTKQNTNVKEIMLQMLSSGLIFLDSNNFL